MSLEDRDLNLLAENRRDFVKGRVQLGSRAIAIPSARERKPAFRDVPVPVIKPILPDSYFIVSTKLMLFLKHKYLKLLILNS